MGGTNINISGSVTLNRYPLVPCNYLYREVIKMHVVSVFIISNHS